MTKPIRRPGHTLPSGWEIRQAFSEGVMPGTVTRISQSREYQIHRSPRAELVKGPPAPEGRVLCWCMGCDEVRPFADMKWYAVLFLCRKCWHDLDIKPEQRQAAV